MGKHSRILDSWKHEAIVHGAHVPVYGVTKSSKYGVFTNTVIPCPQDYQNINDWDGYKFAERKCDIDIAHAKAKKLRERISGIESLYLTLFNKYKQTNNEAGFEFLKDVEHQMQIAKKEYEQVYAQYKYMKDDFSDYTTRMINRRKELNEKIQKQRKDNN